MQVPCPSCREEPSPGAPFRCPTCYTRLAPSDDELRSALLLCPRCGAVHDRARTTDVALPDLSQPPRGIQFSRDADGFELRVSTGSYLALVPALLLLVWCTVVLVDAHDTFMKRWFLTLPITVALALPVLEFAIGELRVRVSGDAAEVFVGAGALGLRRRFSWRSVQRVRVTAASRLGRKDGSSLDQITLDAARRIDFGFRLPRAQRLYMLQVLRRMLVERDEAA